MATSRWTPIARKLVAIPQRCHFSSLTLRSSRRAAVRWPGAEAPRASQIQVSVWPAREGRARLSDRTLGRPRVHPEERSDEGSLVQRAEGARIARTARRAVNLLLLTMLGWAKRPGV